jgi:hypothetical protein
MDRHLSHAASGRQAGNQHQDESSSLQMLTTTSTAALAVVRLRRDPHSEEERKRNMEHIETSNGEFAAENSPHTLTFCGKSSGK